MQVDPWRELKQSDSNNFFPTVANERLESCPKEQVLKLLLNLVKFLLNLVNCNNLQGFSHSCFCSPQIHHVLPFYNSVNFMIECCSVHVKEKAADDDNKEKAVVAAQMHILKKIVGSRVRNFTRFKRNLTRFKSNFKTCYLGQDSSLSLATVGKKLFESLCFSSRQGSTCMNVCARYLSAFLPLLLQILLGAFRRGGYSA